MAAIAATFSGCWFMYNASKDILGICSPSKRLFTRLMHGLVLDLLGTSCEADDGGDNSAFQEPLGISNTSKHRVSRLPRCLAVDR